MRIAAAAVLAWAFILICTGPTCAGWTQVMSVDGQFGRDKEGRLSAKLPRQEMHNIATYKIEISPQRGNAFFPRLQILDRRGNVLSQGGSDVIFWPESKTGYYDIRVDCLKNIRGGGRFTARLFTQAAVDYVFEEARAVTNAIDNVGVADPKGFFKGKGKTYCNYFVQHVSRNLAAIRTYRGARPWKNAVIPVQLAHTGVVRSWLLPYYNKSEQLNPGRKLKLMANTQQDWLKSEGLAKGWRQVTWYPQSNPRLGLLKVQALANRGYLVVASWKNPAGLWAHGHIAVIRPHAWQGKFDPLQGPRIAQAGKTNFSSGTMIRGFARSMWKDTKYFVFRHALTTYAPPAKRVSPRLRSLP